MPKTLGKKLIDRYRVADGRKFRLADFAPADTAGLALDGKAAKRLLQSGVEQLADLQARLYAQDRWGILVIFQAMDAAGKDGTIKHVMSGVNPQGVHVSSFKAPSGEVLVVRVHEEILRTQHLPPELLTTDVWKHRYQDMKAFERYLSHNGYRILKFFLHVSKKEQKRRFLERLDEPDKNWKFSIHDVEERARWKQYMRAYETMIVETASGYGPWHVVPADNKWFTRLYVALAIVEALRGLDLKFPKIDPAKRREIERARKLLS
jgi:polyphosphate kinase 2 (PPK2 family)